MGVRVKGEGEEEAGKEGGSWNECKKYPSLPFFFFFLFGVVPGECLEKGILSFLFYFSFEVSCR